MQVEEKIIKMTKCGVQLTKKLDENFNGIKEKCYESIHHGAESNINHENSKNILSSHRASIKSFYQDAHVLVTGGTGFLGKVLLEKLLRTCDSLQCIYVLLRPKRGIGIEQRHRELVENPIFDRIRNDHPERLNKIVFIAGDLSKPNIGVSDADSTLLKEKVQVVFHSAAAVRFDQVMNEAVESNALASKRLWDLCLGMENLRSIIHVSTAYTNPTRQNVDEVVYPPKVPMDPETFIKCAEVLPENLVSKIATQLYGEHPNTYTVTKAIAEQISADYHKKLPISIVRPPIITSSVAEPYPGWVDSISAMTGFLMEFGRGTVSTIIGDGKLITDVIPVDIVSNTMITAAWFNCYKPSHSLRVYNCTSGSLNPLNWETIRRKILHYSRLYPSKYMMMHPNFSFRTNRFVHFIIELFLHLLPAFLYDFVLRYNGEKPVMMKIAKRYKKVADSSEFFRSNEFNFDAKNVIELLDEIAAADDGSEFPCDIRVLDWAPYFRDYWFGIRKYIFKEDPSTFKSGGHRIEMLYKLKLFVQSFCFGLIALIFYKLFN